MPLDDARLRTVLRAIHDTLSPAEASAILDVARLAAAIDKKSNVDEMLVLLSLTRIICEMAGLAEMPMPTKAIDEHRLFDISDSLVPTGARELAFACAFLVMILDLELTQEENKLVHMLGDAMVLDPSRAKHLSKEMEALVRVSRIELG